MLLMGPFTVSEAKPSRKHCNNQRSVCKRIATDLKQNCICLCAHSCGIPSLLHLVAHGSLPKQKSQTLHTVCNHLCKFRAGPKGPMCISNRLASAHKGRSRGPDAILFGQDQSRPNGEIFRGNTLRMYELLAYTMAYHGGGGYGVQSQRRRVQKIFMSNRTSLRHCKRFGRPRFSNVRRTRG